MLCAKLQAINSKINLTSGCRNLPPQRRARYERGTNLTSFQYAPFLFVSLSLFLSLNILLSDFICLATNRCWGVTVAAQWASAIQLAAAVTRPALGLELDERQHHIEEERQKQHHPPTQL